MPPSRALGIDLGTTVTALAYVDEAGRSAMVRSLQGDLLIPSVVYFEEDEVLYGRAAKQAALTQPSRAGEMVKRDRGQSAYSRAIGGQLWPTEVVEACLLRKICSELPPQVAARPGAVLALPAGFDQAQRRSFLDAAQIAGLDVVGIINEPMAAAVAFAESQGYLQPDCTKPGCRVLVFDLGGGSLDAAVIEVKPGRVRTMAIGGLARLGGRDWDVLLAEHLAGVFEKQFGEDPRYDMVSVRRLLESAEEVKNALSARQQTRVHVERGGHSADITVTRTMFEELAEPLVEQARRLTEGVLTYSGLTRRDLAHLILVGGASRMPMIVKMLETLTDLKPATSVHPDEAVARGAALYAANLIDTRTGRTPRIALELTNLTAHNVGMEWTDPETGRVENVVLIARGTELPCGMITQVTTTEDGQTAFEFQLLEGDSREADKCARIGKVVISGLPAGLPKGWPIQVQCQYTAVGRVQIKAQIEKTGQELTVELRRPSALAESEVAEWRKLLANREGMAALRLLGERLEKKQAEAAAAAQSAALPAAVAMGGPPPTTVTQNVGVIEDIQLAPREESLSRNLRRGRNTPRQLAIMAIGYVISAALGLGIGYYILMRIDPAYNWWHLRLPGLASPPPAAAPAG